MADDELTAAAGWCAPEGQAYLSLELPPAEYPDVKVTRGGPQFGDLPKREPRPPFVPPAPPEGETTETGHWEFGVRSVDEDGDEEFSWSDGVYVPERYTDPRDAWIDWSHEPNAELVRRWVRHPLPWEPHT